MRDPSKVFSYRPVINQLPFPPCWIAQAVIKPTALLPAGRHIPWFHLRKVTVKKEEAGLMPITLFSRVKTLWRTSSGTYSCNLYVHRAGEECANQGLHCRAHEHTLSSTHAGLIMCMQNRYNKSHGFMYKNIWIWANLNWEKTEGTSNLHCNSKHTRLVVGLANERQSKEKGSREFHLEFRL